MYTHMQNNAYLINSRRHPKDFTVGIDENIGLVPHLVVAIGAAEDQVQDDLDFMTLNN